MSPASLLSSLALANQRARASNHRDKDIVSQAKNVRYCFLKKHCGTFFPFLSECAYKSIRRGGSIVESCRKFPPIYFYFHFHYNPICATIYLHTEVPAHGVNLFQEVYTMIKYKFSNTLMFALVMQDEELCAEFIERLFPGRKVKSITFPNNIRITPEKTIVTGLLSKSVRLDVLFEGEREVYDIEMQVENDPDLAKRSRYYHSSMDTNFLQKGHPYKDLKPGYVIFICLHDPFNMEEAVYHFEQFDRNLQLKLNDETYTIILAIDCPKGKIPKELESFFAYVESDEVDESDDFVKRIHQKVEEANRNAEVTEIMTIEEEMKVRWDWGYREGETAGLEKGRSEGETLKQREIAKAMKRKSMPLAEIAELTGLTAEEVKKL